MMQDSFEIYEDEFHRLKPVYEEEAGVDLSSVRIVKGTGNCYNILSRLVEINEACDNQFSSESTTWLVGHELSHAVESALWGFEMGQDPLSQYTSELIRGFPPPKDDSEEFWKCRAVSRAITEGFALYFQFSYVTTGIDEKREEENKRMLESILKYANTGVEDEIIYHLGWAETYIPGYVFFRDVVSLSGKPDIIFDILKCPPMSEHEFGNPAFYLRKRFELIPALTEIVNEVLPGNFTVGGREVLSHRDQGRMEHQGESRIFMI